MKYIIIFLILTVGIYSQDFRKTKWGMTKKEVISKLKTKEIVKKENMVIEYNALMLNSRCIILYQFTSDDKLNLVLVNFINPSSESFIKNMRNDLASKYGDYKEVDLKEGSATLNYLWEMERTVIGLGIGRDSVCIIYFCNLQEMKDKVQQDKLKEF